MGPYRSPCTCPPAGRSLSPCLALSPSPLLALRRYLYRPNLGRISFARRPGALLPLRSHPQHHYVVRPTETRPCSGSIPWPSSSSSPRDHPGRCLSRHARRQRRHLPLPLLLAALPLLARRSYPHGHPHPYPYPCPHGLSRVQNLLYLYWFPLLP